MTKEKFILVSLKEDESKKLAQIVSNDTARRILDFLAEKEATESQLADKLGIPISTVHYNLQALVKGKLVEADQYHYSDKGKEVLHYRLANKYIIIAPKSTFGIKEKLKSILPVALFIGAAAGFIQFISKKFIPRNILFNAPAPEAFVDDLAAPIAARGGGALQTAVNKTMEIAADEALEAEAAVLEEAIPETINEVIPEAVNKTVEHVWEPVFQVVPKEPTIWTSVALWFLIGAVSALAVYIIIEYFRHKKK